MLILSIPKAADGNRTHDLFLTKEVLYRLSYSSDFIGRESRVRSPQSKHNRLRTADSRLGTLPERAMGFEPTTSCLEGRNSTAELHPHPSRMKDEGGRMRQIKLLPASSFILHPSSFHQSGRRGI